MFNVMIVSVEFKRKNSHDQTTNLSTVLTFVHSSPPDTLLKLST